MNSINFIEPLSPKQQEARLRWARMTSISFLFLFIFTCLSFIRLGCYYLLIKKKEHDIIKQQQTIKSHQSDYQLLQSNIEHHKKILSQANIIKTKRHWPFQILEEIAQHIPEDIHLISYEQGSKKLFLQVCALSYDAITKFLTTLEHSSLFSQCSLIAFNRTINNDAIMVDIQCSFKKKSLT